MSQNESTTFLVTGAKNLTLIDATRENSPWCLKGSKNFKGKTNNLQIQKQFVSKTILVQKIILTQKISGTNRFLI